MNTQMKQQASPTATPFLFPQYPIDSWLLFFIPIDPQTLYYNSGYTPRSNIVAVNAFDSTQNYQKDWSNALIWSQPETDGSNTDNNRIFLPIDIKFLDYSDGKITDARNINGELITLQERVVIRQYFNTTETISTNAGSEIILGDGGVLRRKGQVLTNFGCQHKWSVVIGKSDKGFDVLYFLDQQHKTICRFGYNGNDSLDEINGMKSFFANNLDFIWNKDNPASGQGVSVTTNQRYREVMWTMRGINDEYRDWDSTENYTEGDIIRYTPAIFSTFEQTGEFYIALISNTNVTPETPTDPQTWQLISHTDNRCYNEYTIVFNEIKNEFQAFHTSKPLMYSIYKNGYLVPRPIENTGMIYKANEGTWTKWFDSDTGSQSGDAYFDAVINKPEGRKRYLNVSVDSLNVPTQMGITTPTGHSHTDSSEFEQREGNEWVGPVMNDDTLTGFSNGNTSSMYGDYAIVRFVIQSNTYNLIEAFAMKVRMAAREIFK